uniref:Cysteine-rich PDZ-binding protein n=1 Tax=Megaselia scalaris TaxID=36166 RepID=T1GFK2_MEGSC
MVCAKCEAKLSKIVTPDPWKAGARNTTQAGGAGRKVNENKALTSYKDKANPVGTSFKPCRICRSKVHQAGSHYCQSCAYKKGICAMCGKKLLDTKNYRQSST